MPTLTQRILYTLIYLYPPLHHSFFSSSLPCLVDKDTFSLTFSLLTHSLCLWSIFPCITMCQLTVVFLAVQYRTGTDSQTAAWIDKPSLNCLCRTALLHMSLLIHSSFLDYQPFLLCIGPGLSTNTARLRGLFVIIYKPPEPMG